MAVEQRDKGLVAIGAGIGALCRPCIDHHFAAGRDAGSRSQSSHVPSRSPKPPSAAPSSWVFRHSRDPLRREETSIDASVEAAPASRRDGLVALGASIGANCHSLLQRHVTGMLERGLPPSQLRSAIKLPGIVQQHAAGITADKAAAAIEAAERNPDTGPLTPTAH